MTPLELAQAIVDKQEFVPSMKVLEPGFGEGSFLIAVIERFMHIRNNNLAAVLSENVWGIEIDKQLYEETLNKIRDRWGVLPEKHNLVCGDYLLESYGEMEIDTKLNQLHFLNEEGFDLIIGNPPFGGTVNINYQDVLEKKYGRRNGYKIKKETYAFFIVKSLNLVCNNGKIVFICSNTFLTIQTMHGLRRALLDEGQCEIETIKSFSEETSYPMVLLSFRKGLPSASVTVDGILIMRQSIELTGNFSWNIGDKYIKYFNGPNLGKYVVASSGMTTGKNEYFVRDIDCGKVIEPYDFEYIEDAIRLENEIARAKLGYLSEKMRKKIIEQEQNKIMRRNVRIKLKTNHEVVILPHENYKYYNKAQGGIYYANPKYAIYWKDDGDAVKTFKKNSNWYLHGVGGMPFFFREGITWRLVASRLYVRYLPEGYVLDSGAPCAFLHPDVNYDELWYILGWANSDLASEIMKNVINHTMNIQGKDFERLPYPWWVSGENKSIAISMVKSLVNKLMSGEDENNLKKEINKINQLYIM